MMKFFVIYLSFICFLDGFYAKHDYYLRNKQKNDGDYKSTSEKFISAEKGIVDNSETADGRHTLTFHISKSKSDKSEFSRYVLKGSKLRVNFISDYYINFASFNELNSTGGEVWAPNNSSYALVRIENDKKTIIVEFHNQIDEKFPKNWTLLTLRSHDLCERRKPPPAPPPACDYPMKGKIYMSRRYVVLFEVIGVRVSVNNKTLTYSQVFPHNNSYTYDFQYRPNTQHILCTFEGLGPVRSQWMKGLDGKHGLSQKRSTPDINYDLTLYQEDDGEIFYCMFNNNQNETIAIAAITFKYISVSELLIMKINDKKLDKTTRIDYANDDSGESHRVYYQKDEEFDITCLENKIHCQKYDCRKTFCLLDIDLSSKHKAKCQNNTINRRLTEKDNGTKVECTYTYGDIPSTVAVTFVLKVVGRPVATKVPEMKAHNEASVTLLVNGAPKEDGDTYIYEPGTELTINCLSSLEMDARNSLSVLKLYKNDELIKQEEERIKDIDNQTYNYKGKSILSLNVTSLITIPTDEEETVLKCSLEEKLGDKSVPYHDLNKKVTLQRRILIPTTTNTPTTEWYDVDISDESALANQGIIGESWFYPVVACFGFVIIVTIGCIIKISRKKTRDTEELVTPEDDHPNETPPPNFPPNASLEETYCKPFDCHPENNYATPYAPKSPEDLYAKPIPKTLRKPLNDALYASLDLESNYAKVKPKNQRNKDLEEPNYATVGEALKDEQTYEYASIGNRSDNYTNVFDDSSYVNSKGSEYVEPSYCEVGVKKK